jgi:hypothetical protein
MKKLLVLSLFTAFALGVYAKGTTGKLTDEIGVTQVTKKQFESDFKDAKNVSWSISDLTQKASFVLNDHKMSAFYDLQGKYLGTTKQVDFNDMPFKTIREVSETYKGYSPVSVIQVADRPVSSESDDTGAYVVSMTNSEKTIYVKVSTTGYVSLLDKI